MTRIKKFKILILGCNGFFGKNFKKLLNKEEYEIICLDKQTIDFIDYKALNDFFQNTMPNIVIHCAGIVGSSEFNKLNNQFDILNTNIIINSNILNCCKLCNVQKIFMFSTYRMVSDDINADYEETTLKYKLDNENQNSGYLLSKNILHEQIRIYNQCEKGQITCFILSNVYGKYDTFSINGRIIPSLIWKIQNAIQYNTNVEMNCNENTEINIIYINDIINIVEKCIQNDVSGDIIVFNTEHIFTLQEISQSIKSLMKFQHDILFQNDIPFINSNIMKPNISKFKKYFPDFEYTELLYSLKETVDYYISLQPN